MSSSLAMLLDYSSEEEEIVDMQMEADQSDENENIEMIVERLVGTLVSRVDGRFRDFFAYRQSGFLNQFHSDDESDSSDQDEKERMLELAIDDWFPSEDDEEEEDVEDLWDENGVLRKPRPCVTRGEVTITDLPPIEKLNINVEVHELVQVGCVTSIVDCLVVIDSFKNIPALDLDSILFVKDGQALGKIFDTIGPVAQPSYVLRFNTHAEPLALGLIVGQTPVYYAESREQPITKFVFVSKLWQERGSDASWEDNNEPPAEALDYSDDETERREKWRHISKNRRRNGGGGPNVFSKR